jgi:hypothetical protein
VNHDIYKFTCEDCEYFATCEGAEMQEPHEPEQDFVYEICDDFKPNKEAKERKMFIFR